MSIHAARAKWFKLERRAGREKLAAKSRVAEKRGFRCSRACRLWGGYRLGPHFPKTSHEQRTPCVKTCRTVPKWYEGCQRLTPGSAACPRLCRCPSRSRISFFGVGDFLGVQVKFSPKVCSSRATPSPALPLPCAHPCSHRWGTAATVWCQRSRPLKGQDR